MIPFLITSVFLLLIPVQADTSVCQGASKAQTPHFDVSWCVSEDQTNIIFTIKASMYNFFGIGYHQNMTNANYTIVEIENGEILVRNYWTQRHQRPRLLEYNGLNLIGIDSDNTTYITVKYSLPMNSPQVLRPDFVTGRLLNFSLAWTDRTTVSNHGSNLQYFSGKLQNGTNVQIQIKSPSISSTTLAHGIVLTICWCLLADLAIILITYRYRLYAYVLHIVLMTIVLVGNLIVVIMMLRRSSNLSHFGDLSNLQKGHLIIGLMILGWFGIQLISGGVVRVFQIFTSIHPKCIKYFSYIHLISGYMMIILAKMNVLWGWWMTGLRIPFWILFAWNIAMILALAFRKISQTFTKFAGYRNIPQSVKYNTYSTNMQMFVNNRPYNHLDLRNFQYMIFADHVYSTQKFRKIHPGGKYIIDSLKGREIDRFIYGMYAPETLPQFSPFEHSQQVFKAIGPPEFKLNQPLENGSLIKYQGEYRIVKCQMFSKDFFAVYFAPTVMQSALFSNPSQGFEYLGQYYTLSAFGKTRLYTRVQCLMPQNKKLQLKVLQNLGYKSTFDVGSHFIPTNTSDPNNPTQRNLVTDPNLYSVGFLMKQYKTGAFTSRLLSSFNNQIPVIISPPLGRGLDIDKISPGRIVIFAGGTGIFPFIDLIDILFKIIVIEDSHCPANEVYKLSPVLERHNLLLLFTFQFHVALQNLNDIHPVHFNMIHFITSSRPNLIKFNFKIKQKATLTMSPGMHYIKQRFNTQYITKQGLTSGKLSMIYICGPPIMNAQLLKGFKEAGVGDHQVFIL